MRASLLSVASLALLLQACIFADQECPCGASTSDPIGTHDRSFSGAHTVDDQCLCTCGDDFPVSFDEDRACREYETACVDEEGQKRTFFCH